MNTGNGWSTWNTGGQFVSWYVADSADHGAVAVFPYYMLLQSNPATGGTESAKDLSNLADPTTMAAWYADLRLFFQRAAGAQTVVLHVEPDLWGYIEQATGTNDDATQIPASVASSGDAALAGLPNTAAGFARAIVRLRDQLAPERAAGVPPVRLGHELGHRVLEQPGRAGRHARGPRRRVLPLAWRPVRPDLHRHRATATRRFKQIVYGDGGASRWDDADFVRYARFISGYVADTGHRVVVWQIPLGNTKMRAMNDTWGHYQDNRAQWFLEDPGGTHLAMWRDAGVVALLFGGGADGTTCACDGQGDGVTNPAAINGNTRLSLSADDDGGYFRERAAAYYASGGLDLGFGTPPPPVTPPPPTVTWTRSATASPAVRARRHNETITVLVQGVGGRPRRRSTSGSTTRRGRRSSARSTTTRRSRPG